MAITIPWETSAMDDPVIYSTRKAEIRSGFEELFLAEGGFGPLIHGRILFASS